MLIETGDRLEVILPVKLHFCIVASKLCKATHSATQVQTTYKQAGAA